MGDAASIQHLSKTGKGGKWIQNIHRLFKFPSRNPTMLNKQEIPQEKRIRAELRRCADEIASVDLSMETIRDLLADQI